MSPIPAAGPLRDRSAASAAALADFFVCDIAAALPKDDMASMEHPVFSLSTRPDRRVLSYAHAGIRVEITPSVKGLATIHDKDVLIYCISQLVAA
ncbi:MAG: replication initiator protein A, partial [Pseudomonadota bacterium]